MKTIRKLIDDRARERRQRCGRAAGGAFFVPTIFRAQLEQICMGRDDSIARKAR